MRYVLLNHLGRSFFLLIHIGSFSDIIKRHFILSLSKLDFYAVVLSVFLRESTATVSTWLERTESTSFAGRFVRLDPPLFLSSRSYMETYQFLFSRTIFIFPFITSGTNLEVISYSINSGTSLKTNTEGNATEVLCFK